MIGNAFSHYFKFSIGKEQPNTQTSARERSALVKYASGARSAVEIGVFEGVNTAIIANTIPADGILYGIDPFFKGRIGICYSKLITLSHLKKSKVRDKVKLIEKLSFEASQDVPESIDFLFIDGDHSLEGIRKDWAIFSEKIRSGGIVALHDTTVTEANRHIEGLGSVIYFKDVISKDPRYTHLETIDSLNILRRN